MTDESACTPFSRSGDTFTLADARVAPLSLLSVITETLERCADCAVRNREESLALEAWSLALRIRYVTTQGGERDAV